jgi:hypothetical protein
MTPLHDPPAGGIAIPIRLRAELERRIRELEARCPRALKPCERRELASLRELLKISAKGTANDD